MNDRILGHSINVKFPPLWLRTVLEIHAFVERGERSSPFAVHELLKQLEEPPLKRKSLHRILTKLQFLGLVARMPHGYHYRHWRVTKTWPASSQEVVDRYAMLMHLMTASRGRVERGSEENEKRGGDDSE